ncbi:TIGR02680 family protein [Steroidobacter sp. S1-65]|uniref:TIGR02680 family protein n=1 Tax=Steroidobacter gossypii TaxID=2805490 RepID=A0ABS1WX50_9GAMM|nr:TIGR02680 family protein [Steroidobacter gossypii]MBM0105554.1 TIGR02680 family protein [Steroidobacter gossypii]
MKDTPSKIPLPEPTRERWQPLRLGLVEMYHYDVEEFWFRDGHLLLRGNNGTGKSKVLSLTLPFLLDANLSSSRVEPDGDRTKRMDWNLLMNGRHQRRIGYTWLEFGRKTSHDETQILTLGCGMKAIAGRSTVDTWFFITQQRIGMDLWLTTHERMALSRERLEEALGSHGQIFPTASAYRRAVDERLFRMGQQRYGALVDTLIQLRQPQLSKQPDERRLSEALTEALPPLDRAALEDVAEAMSQLEDMRRELQELEAMRAAIASFTGRYRRYAQIATRRRARLVRQSQTEFDQTSRELNDAKAALERARELVSRSQERQRESEDLVAMATARLAALNQDPLMRDAFRIEEARRDADRCRRSVADADQRAHGARARADRESRLAAERRSVCETTREKLVRTFRSVTELATTSGVVTAMDRVLEPALLPDGLQHAPNDLADKVLQVSRDAERRRREQIAIVRRRRVELEEARQLLVRAKDSRAVHAEAFDRAEQALQSSIAELRAASAELLQQWRDHCARLHELDLAGSDELLGELETWVENQAGPNPLRVALERAWESQQTQFAAREAELGEQRKKLQAEQSSLKDEQSLLLRGEDKTPPAPYTRAVDVRMQKSGAPLWQVVDFADHVASEQRAVLEAALEASGLLDAWVSSEGVLTNRRTQDVMLTPRRACVGPSLREWLKPTIPQSGPGASLSEAMLLKIMDAIACSDDEPIEAEAWISPAGEFRVGALRGFWEKPSAEYIGHAAREAARQARLAAIKQQLAQLDLAFADIAAALDELSERRRFARGEVDEAPSDDRLLRAHSHRITAEEQRRGAQARLGHADARVLQVEENMSLANSRLEADARDLSLPVVEDQILSVELALSDFRAGATELSGAIQAHRNSLREWNAQQEREQTALADVEAAVLEEAENRRAQRVADELLATLEATVGKQVSELLQEIRATETSKREHETSLQRARAELIVASSNRGTAEAKCSALTERLTERVEHRRRAIDELQTFAARTGLLEVAVPGVQLPSADAEWGIEAALIVARRAEQILVEVAAEDADWSRIQATISRDLTELQSAMSAQAHAVEAELSDFGLIVRITYQQQLQRPDTLELRIDADLQERRMLLSAQERAVLEQHLEKEIAANLQRMIQDTEQRVAAINAELYRRPTSTGVRYKLDWQVVPDEDPNAVAGLAEARKRLLRTRADAWSAEDRQQVGEFLRARIDAERLRDEQASLSDNLARALDYRRWHRFRVQRLQDGAWKPLSGPASSGERALGLTVPLFAAASSHYESAHAHAPRLVLMDEAFAGIDDEARANCMALIREFDLDFVMTSEREWGCYPALPGLSICQLIRREGMDAVYVTRWAWDGRERREQPDPERRFPEALSSEG